MKSELKSRVRTLAEKELESLDLLDSWVTASIADSITDGVMNLLEGREQSVAPPKEKGPTTQYRPSEEACHRALEWLMDGEVGMSSSTIPPNRPPRKGAAAGPMARRPRQPAPLPDATGTGPPGQVRPRRLSHVSPNGGASTTGGTNWPTSSGERWATS